MSAKSTPDGQALSFRAAVREDVPYVVRVLADDPLGALRESDTAPLPESYYIAFEAIEADPRNELIIVECDGTPAGFLQLTIIPYMTYTGRPRALIEGVRIDKAHQGKGIGRHLVLHAIEKARSHHCHLVQLTSDKKRDRAISFYESLGFTASHEGMKLHLKERAF